MSENENVVSTENEATEEKKMSYDDLMTELSRVRNEAASRRIENRELKEQADKWKQYEDSQKTELQRLQEALAERDKKLSSYELERTRISVAKELGLDVDDADLLTGSDEATIRKQAERLKERIGKVEEKNSSRPADLLAGNRGTPVGTSAHTSNVDDLIRQMSGRRR